MDFRYALRNLTRSPGFLAMSVATIALGIAINTIVFTLYNSVALKPLAVRAPAEVSRLQWRTDGPNSELFSWQDFERIRAQGKSLESVVATSAPQTAPAQLPEWDAVAEIVQIRLVSPNYFRALGVRPVLGRGLEGDRAGVVMSHTFWERKFASDPGVFLRTINIQGTPLPVLGVAPKEFAGTGAPPQTPDLWVSAAAQTSVLPGRDWMHDSAAREWQILTRRRPGTAQARQAAELTVIAGTLTAEDGKPVHLSARKATFFQTDSGEFAGFESVCLILLAAVTLILLMGCVNLVNLIAARNAARGHEMGVRLALGASRLRLVRQLCTESLILGALGGAAGLLVSVWSCEWLGVSLNGFIQEVSGGSLRINLELQPDWRVFLWTVVVSLVTGLAVGLFPALRASRTDVSSALKQGSAGAGHGVEARRTRDLLLAAQVAGCLLLLTSAGLLFRGVMRTSQAHPGFETGHLALVSVNTKGIAGSPAARLQIAQRTVSTLEGAPEVASVAWTDRPPFLGHGSANFANRTGTEANCLYANISDRYFETMGVPLLAGRTFTRAEAENHAPLLVVNEAAARRFWPGKQAIGQKIVADARWASRASGQLEYTVIGVSKTLRSTYLSKDDAPFLYMPQGIQDGNLTLLVRTRTRPAHAFRSLATSLASVDANLPSRAITIGIDDGPLRIQALMTQAPALTSVSLGAVALLLACLGIFGVVSRLVAMRTREIGLRVVLGATRMDIVRLIAGQTLRPFGWGTAAGLAGSFTVSGLLNSMVEMPTAPDLTYGAGAFDPVTFTAVLALLAVTIALAGAVPLRRATGVEPAVALRDE